MKKALSIILAVLLLAALLAACGGGGSSKYEGTYVMTKISDWTVEEYADLLDMTVEEAQASMQIILKSGGKAVFNFDEEPEEVNWKVDGEKITLSADGESITGTLKDNVLTLDFDGEVAEFTKK